MGGVLVRDHAPVFFRASRDNDSIVLLTSAFAHYLIVFSCEGGGRPTLCVVSISFCSLSMFSLAHLSLIAVGVSEWLLDDVLSPFSHLVFFVFWLLLES